MINKIKEEYNEALYNQSFSEMKNVAKKLINYYYIEKVSNKNIIYNKNIRFRNEDYQIFVELNTDGKYDWRIIDINDKLIKYGSSFSDNEDSIFDEIIDNFSNFINI